MAQTVGFGELDHFPLIPEADVPLPLGLLLEPSSVTNEICAVEPQQDLGCAGALDPFLEQGRFLTSPVARGGAWPLLLLLSCSHFWRSLLSGPGV